MEPDSQSREHEELGRLLRWKRHEKPPPGFFATFSHSVLAELEAPQDLQGSWWNSLVSRIAAPALACSYGVMLGGLLFFGLASSRLDEDPSISLQAGVPSAWPDSSPARIPKLDSKNYPILFGSADFSSVRPVIRSGPGGFLLNEGSEIVERASLRFR